MIKENPLSKGNEYAALVIGSLITNIGIGWCIFSATAKCLRLIAFIDVFQK